MTENTIMDLNQDNSYLKIPEHCDAETRLVLKDSKFLTMIIRTIQSLGVVGEDDIIKTETLIANSINCIGIHDTSKNFHPEDVTGVGKDFVTKKVSQVVHHEKWIHVQDPTPTAFIYTENETDSIELDQQAITRNSIVHIEDASEDFINSSGFKMMLSGDTRTLRTNVERKSKLIELPKPIVIVTSCDTKTDTQLHRRLPSGHLNSTEEQTIQILKRQGIDGQKLPQEILTKEQNRELYLIRKAHLMLQEVYVVIPKEIVEKVYNEILPKKKIVLLRTINKTILDYIKMSATIFQYQRERNEEDSKVDRTGYPTIIANLQDFEIAKSIYEYLYGDEDEILPFNYRQRKQLKKFREEVGIFYTIEEISSWKGVPHASDPTIRDDIKKLVEYTEVELEKDSYPAKYGIHGRMKIKPVGNSNTDLNDLNDLNL